MKIVEKDYCSESITDIEEDMFDSMRESDLPTDEHGFAKGVFRVVVTFVPDEKENKQ